MMPPLCCNNRFFNMKPVLALRVEIFYSNEFPKSPDLIHDS